MSASKRMGTSTDPLKREIERQYARQDVDVVETADPVLPTMDVMACSPLCIPERY